MSCEHDIVEMDVAIGADGLCPLCLSEDVSDMHKVLADLVKWFDRYEREWPTQYLTSIEYFDLREIVDDAKEHTR